MRLNSTRQDFLKHAGTLCNNNNHNVIFNDNEYHDNDDEETRALTIDNQPSDDDNFVNRH